MSSSNNDNDDEQLAEYKSQLSDIELLLADSADDESLLKLKSDLLELIQLTEDQQEDGEEGLEHSSHNHDEGDGDDNVTEAVEEELPTQQGENQNLKVGAATVATDDGTLTNASIATETSTAIAAAAAKSKASLKKSKKLVSKPFEIPSHLIPLDSDTDAERKRKKRTLRALKSQYKSTQKAVESELKQNSWQDFQKKTKKKRKGASRGESIFKTEDGVAARTGVITGSVSVMGQERTNEKIANASSKRQRHAF
jgi:survival-of-motor-neuron-related-splicing factor 30